MHRFPWCKDAKTLNLIRINMYHDNKKDLNKKYRRTSNQHRAEVRVTDATGSAILLSGLGATKKNCCYMALYCALNEPPDAMPFAVWSAFEAKILRAEGMSQYRSVMILREKLGCHQCEMILFKIVLWINNWKMFGSGFASGVRVSISSLK